MNERRMNFNKNNGITTPELEHLLLIKGSVGVSGVLAVSRCFDVLLERLWGVILSGLRSEGILLGDFTGDTGEVGPFRS